MEMLDDDEACHQASATHGKPVFSYLRVECFRCQDNDVWTKGTQRKSKMYEMVTQRSVQAVK